MTVQEIYERYRIMPALQLHQLRVAAVAHTICGSSERELDRDAVIYAALFHDMGNIIKSDLDTFPDFLEPEGRAHWQLVKDEFIGEYGESEHEAAIRIAKEIGLSARAIELIDGVGFSMLVKTRESSPFELKIVEYADLRVGPHGVLSLTARIQEAKIRYAGKHPDMPRSEDEFERLRAAAIDIELQIFEEIEIAPDDITEQSVKPLIEELRALPVA